MHQKNGNYCLSEQVKRTSHPVTFGAMKSTFFVLSSRLLSLTAGVLLPLTPRTSLINYPNATHNPLFPGFYADPEIRIYDDTFWIFPTTSIAFEDQTYFDAFSSPDLVTWTKHPDIFTASGWARDNFWAPTSWRGQDGRYYFYFSANGLRSQHEDAGLGVLVADRPEVSALVRSISVMLDSARLRLNERFRSNAPYFS